MESAFSIVNKKAKANMMHRCEQIMMPRGRKQKGNASTTLLLLLVQKFYLMSRASEAEHCHARWLQIVHFRLLHLSKA